MRAVLRCDDARLVAWLLSNPASSSNGAVMVLCGGRNFTWPIPADDIDSKKEAA